MSQTKKTDFLKLIAGAVLATASVVLLRLITDDRFSSVSIILLSAFAVAFTVEALILRLMKKSRGVLRVIKILLLFVINFTVFTSAVMISFPPAIILQPHNNEAAYRELCDTQEVEKISFHGRNGSINGWIYSPYGDEKPTVLYFYGNYETASSSMLNFLRAENTCFGECNIAVFDYPAYGKSEGRCTDKSLLEFSVDAYDYLSERTDNIIIAGYSVGTGPAVFLASEKTAAALILIAPYAEGADLYNNVIDIFHGPMKMLVTFNIESIKYAKNTDEKTLVFSSHNDRVIPFTSSERLAAEFESCIFRVIPDTGHNDYFAHKDVRSAIRSFIGEVNEDEK